MRVGVDRGTLLASNFKSLVVRRGALSANESLPVLVAPAEAEAPLSARHPDVLELVERALQREGAILFRGFAPASTEAFRRFADELAGPLLSYDFASTPRTQVEDGVYSSTEYPPHQHIPLHNEQSYSRRWPMKIWFQCLVPAAEGGETPLADSRQIYERMPARARQHFIDRGLMYVRNFGGGLDVPWRRAFGTEDRSEVDAYCRRQGIHCEWKPDGELRTRHVCQVVARHPRTGDMVWFNQAHLFHVSALEQSVREALLDVVEPADLPRNVYHADGSEIDESLLEEVRSTLEACRCSFPWNAGDILMLDNMLVAHARTPFVGPRKVIVAMAEAHSEIT
jgi:alpha-ketoglutarate-dependent taurine dioxygenase